MAATPVKVERGDLITAQGWNDVVEALIALQEEISKLAGSAAATGTVTVPSVFGCTIAQALTIIQASAQQLGCGTVLDTAGAVVNTSVTAARSRLVISQSPSAGIRVPAGSSINLLVAGTSGGTTPTPTPVEVTIASVTPDHGAEGDPVVIAGTGYDLAGHTTVTFNDIRATVTSSNLPKELTVIVPSGVPGAPAAGGGSLSNVKLTVAVPSGKVTTWSRTFTIDPPTGPARPAITGFVPTVLDGGADEGAVIAILGTGFSNDRAKIRVTFDEVDATIVKATTTELQVVIPDLIGVHPGNSPKQDVKVVVSRQDRAAWTSSAPTDYTVTLPIH